MEKQSLIRRPLSSPAGFERLSAILEGEAFENRSAAVRRVCEAFGFLDARGPPQASSCRSGLAAMERVGRVSLPPASKCLRPAGPAMLGHPVPDPAGVPDRAGLVEGFELVPVHDLASRRIFNEMMEREHPLGARTQFGRQLRYLVGSAHGWLGGLHFASPALAVAARDAWIGWDAETREERLHLAVGLERFLIRPQVRCRNLASMALAACARRLADDFEAVHGIRPVLAETYVGPEHRGSCFLAYGWTPAGETTGRTVTSRGKMSPLFELETCMPRRGSNQMLRCQRKIQFRNKNLNSYFCVVLRQKVSWKIDKSTPIILYERHRLLNL